MGSIRIFGEKKKQTWFVNGLNVLIECAWNAPSILLVDERTQFSI